MKLYYSLTQKAKTKLGFLYSVVASQASPRTATLFQKMNAVQMWRSGCKRTVNIFIVVSCNSNNISGEHIVAALSVRPSVIPSVSQSVRQSGHLLRYAFLTHKGCAVYALHFNA